MKRPQGCLQTQLGCMRLWANRISISAWEEGRQEGGKARGRGAEGGGRGGVTFGVGAAAVNIYAGYQHGLVSMLAFGCIRQREEGERENKRKRNK